MTGAPLVVCWGEILWDRFPDQLRLGGAPANVAYHLAQIGAHVAMVSRIGDDELGRRAIDHLARAGVDTSAVQIDGERPTGAVAVSVEAGEPCYSLIEDCAWERVELAPAARAAVERAAAVCYGTLSQRTPIGRASLTAALQAAPASCLAVCDPNLRPKHIDHEVVAASLAAADIIKLNEAEAVSIATRLGGRIATGHTALDVADRLLAAGASLVAITRGAGGCTLMSADDFAEHPGWPAAPGGDNVGAGDAFTAVLTHMHITGAPLAHIAELANRYAAHVASCRGATPVIPEALLRELGFRQS